METINEATTNELRELFNKLKKSTEVTKLVDINKDSGDTPAENADSTQPHFDEIFNRLEAILSEQSSESPSYPKILAMKSSLLYEQAKLLLTSANYDSSQVILEKALSVIEPLHSHPQITFLHLRLINHLAYLLSKLGNLERARSLLESVGEPELYKNVIVYSTEDLFSGSEVSQEQAAIKLNKLITNNLQMLGWICGRLGLHDIHAIKQHKALERQLQTNESDPVLWANRCARLAALFLTRLQWVPARYHLAAAGSVLDRIEREMITHPDLGKAQADLARGWIHYGLHLFNTSKTQILDKVYSENFDSEDVLEESEKPLDAELTFSNLEFAIEPVPASLIKNTDQARCLFLHTHTWLKRARLYYTLRDYPLQYVNAVLDLSELYRYLAFYEPDLDSQYNVQKRRADALETLSSILREVRPQCYIAVSVELLRELAEVQIELMGINLRRLYMIEEVQPSEESLKRRIEAVSDIHTKLEKVGDMLGHGNIEEAEVAETEPPPIQDSDIDKIAEACPE